MPRRNSLSLPLLRVFLILVIVGCLAAPMFASPGTRSLTNTSGPSDLAITLTDDPDPVLPDGVFTYTYTLTNNGPANSDAQVLGIVCVGFGCNAGKSGPKPSSSTEATLIDFDLSGSGSTTWNCTPTSGTMTPFNYNCTTTTPLLAGTSSTIVMHVQAQSQEDTIYNSAQFYPIGNTETDYNNNFADEATGVANPCPPVFYDVSPADGSTGVPTSGSLTWSSSHADLYTVYFGPAGGGCSSFYVATTDSQTDYSGLQPGTQYEYRIDAESDSCGVVGNAPNARGIGGIGTTGCISFITAGGSGCATTGPTLLSPAVNDSVVSPITFSWSAVPGATGYLLTTVTNGVNDTISLGSSTRSFVKTLPPGTHQWFVEATFSNCPSVISTRASFTVLDANAICAAPPPTIASVVGESTTGEPYHLLWEGVPVLNTYEIQEASDPNFLDATTFTVTSGLSKEFSHIATEPTPYYYRVRSICGRNASEYTRVVRTVVIPKPNPKSDLFELTSENGNTGTINFSVFIPIAAGTVKTLASNITITTSAPWLAVSPGPVNPGGLALAAAINPTTLPVGTSTATITVATTASGVIASPAVSMTLATPITPSSSKAGPPANALIIPAVANVQGQSSKWQSDIRMTNLSPKKLTYQLTYTPSTVNTIADSKITSFEVKSGQTVALDDIVKHLYGLGSLADGTNGVLEFHPLNFTGKSLPLKFNLSTFASSRTYNLAEDGSVGQFIPAVPFTNFIGSTAENSSVAPLLSLQAIAQNDIYRTNLGIVEGSGQPADVTIRVFNDDGALVKIFFVSLKAGEHQQLNSVLATQNVKLDDGRIELQVTSGTGKIMAYASVVDSRSNDPQLVPAVDITSIKASRYILAGITDFTSQFTKFRSDVRIFNAGSATVSATLTFYPESGFPAVKTVSIGAGKIAALDNIVSSLFGLTNAGGSLFVETAGDSSLVVTARTYDLRDSGTVGQFIPAVTLDESVAKGDRSLQILQVEQSARFRTNLGVAEVTGKPVTVEVTATIPDSLTSPVITLQLKANEFKQLNSVLTQMGLKDQFNARMSVKVIGGDGKVMAYGSVVDNKSQDPTYVPAQ